MFVASDQEFRGTHLSIQIQVHTVANRERKMFLSRQGASDPPASVGKGTRLRAHGIWYTIISLIAAFTSRHILG